MLEGWELLVKKGGDTMQYCDALVKDECVFVAEHAIDHFGVQEITDYVIRALHESLY